MSLILARAREPVPSRAVRAHVPGGGQWSRYYTYPTLAPHFSSWISDFILLETE